MVSDEQVAGGRRTPRRRKGIGGRRRWGGGEVAATPFLEWKTLGGDSVGGAVAAVSARRLAASLWQLAATTSGGGSVRWRSFDRLGFEFCMSVPIPMSATEGTTKWNYCKWEARDDVSRFESSVKLTSAAYARQPELFESQKRANELEDEGWWPGTRTKYCTKKLNEETSSCIRTEHPKMCSVIKNLVDDVARERENCRKMDIMNSKILRDIAEAKLSAQRLIHNLEKEKKAREELEDVCNDLAKEIEGSKAEIGALRNWQKRIEQEVEEERKMLQVAEVWLEEQAQLKLAEAKLILEDKYAEISSLIAELKAFLRRLNLTTDVNMISKARALRQDFDSVNIQRVKNFKCKPPKFTTVKDSQTSGAEARRTDNCISRDQAHYASVIHNINPEVRDATRKSVHADGLTGRGSGFEDTIAIETVTEAEIYSGQTPGESDVSVNKIGRRKYISNWNTESNANVHHESQKSEASEISSVTLMQSKKKGSSACETREALPRNKETCKTITIDGGSDRSISSTISMESPQRVLGEKEHAIGRNPHVVRAMKGHIEWPRGIQRRGLSANLLQTKLASQKTLLRNILKKRS